MVYFSSVTYEKNLCVIKEILMLVMAECWQENDQMLN